MLAIWIPIQVRIRADWILWQCHAPQHDTRNLSSRELSTHIHIRSPSVYSASPGLRRTSLSVVSYFLAVTLPSTTQHSTYRTISSSPRILTHIAQSPFFLSSRSPSRHVASQQSILDHDHELELVVWSQIDWLFMLGTSGSLVQLSFCPRSETEIPFGRKLFVPRKRKCLIIFVSDPDSILSKDGHYRLIVRIPVPQHEYFGTHTSLASTTSMAPNAAIPSHL